MTVLDPHWLIEYSHFREMGLDDDQIAAKFGIARASLDRRFVRMNRRPGEHEVLAQPGVLPTPRDVDDLADRAVEDAADMITRIREEDPQTLWVELAQMPPARLFALVYALAAMVPENRTISQLLAWTQPLAEAS